VSNTEGCVTFELIRARAEITSQIKEGEDMKHSQSPPSKSGKISVPLLLTYCSNMRYKNNPLNRGIERKSPKHYSKGGSNRAFLVGGDLQIKDQL